MNTYVTLMKLTDQGAKDLKQSPKRIEDGIKSLEKMGGKLLGFYIVMGEYDFIGIGEAPSDEAAATFSLALSSLGYVKTTTLRAFTPKDYAGMLKKIP